MIGEGGSLIGLGHFLVLSAGLFSIGVYGLLSKRNAITLLMCVELMFNATNIALVPFARFGYTTAQLVALHVSVWDRLLRQSDAAWRSTLAAGHRGCPPGRAAVGGCLQRQVPDPGLLSGVHARRGGVLPLFRVPLPLRFLDAVAGALSE